MVLFHFLSDKQMPILSPRRKAVQLNFRMKPKSEPYYNINDNPILLHPCKL